MGKTPKKTGKPAQADNGGPSVPTSNRFQNLEDGRDEALEDLLSAMDAVPPSPHAGSGFRVPARPRRRRASMQGSEAPAKRPADNNTPESGRPAPSAHPGTSGSAPASPAPSIITPAVSPAIPNGRTYADVVVGNPQSRQSWHIGNIPANISNIILTDSNGLAWRNTAIPENTVIYTLRGNRLSDGVRMLTHGKAQLQSVRTIIVALGLNDRDRDPSDTISNIRFLHDWTQRSDNNVLFLGVPTFDTLNRSEQDNIGFLNRAAADIFGPQYISLIRADKVHIMDRDGYGIHYSVNTANTTLELLRPFLN